MVAMQTVLAGDMVSIKQRAKAAQQLATLFCELPTMPSLYAYYEPYLPIVASVITAPIKAAKEVQDNARKMLKALGSHSPRQFVDWCALHVSMNPTQEPWYVDWCCGLLLAAETRVPRVQVLTPQANGQRGDSTAVDVWDDRSLEYQELDAATAAVFHIWRTVLDNADDEELVYEIAVHMKTLLCYQPTASEVMWRATVTSKIQPHFVDVADVLIGWAMGSTTSSRLRDTIFELLEEMRELWVGNSVFCLQLLESFSSDVAAIYATPTANPEDEMRLDSIVRCSILIAQCAPTIAALSNNGGELGFVEKLLRSRAPGRFVYSSATVLRLSEYFDTVSAVHADRLTPLGMSAIRFLLVQTASMLDRRHCEAHDALLILERACRLSKVYLSMKTNDSSVLLEASSLLKDTVNDETSGHASSVLERLLGLKYFGTTKYITQIAVSAIALLGVEGLKVVAGVMDDKMKTSLHPYSGFWSTCFILASRDERMAGLLHHFGVLRKTSSTIQSILRSAATLDPTPTLRHEVVASGVLKLAPAFVSLLRKHGSAAFDESTSDLLLEQAKLCVHIGKTAASTSDLSLQETFRALAWAISAYPAKVALPAEVSYAIISQVERALLRDIDFVRAECTAVLAALSPRASSDVSGRVFESMLMLIDDSEGDKVVRQVLPGLRLAALNASSSVRLSSKRTTTSLKNVWIPSELSVGDFELMIGLLSQPESNGDAWYRTCRRIQSRLRQANPDCGRDRVAVMKEAVCEAAKWVIQARLRSPMGPPSAIFSSVEKMLLNHASYRRSASRSTADGKPYPSRISTAMLIEFVLAIETAFGIVTDLKCPDSNPESDGSKVQGFFRANVGVCEEWLSRIRPTLVELSSYLKQTESGVHHSFALVTTLSRKLDLQLQRQGLSSVSNDLRVRMMKQTAELEIAVFKLAEMLCELGDSDGIVGLQQWWVELLTRVASFLGQSSAASVGCWLQAMTLEAEMKYEDAARAFEALVGHVTSVQHPTGERIDTIMHPLSTVGVTLEVFVGSVRRCGRCYTNVRHWKAIQELHSRCWWFAEAIAGKSQGDQAFAAFVELCTTWKGESSMVAALLTSDQLSRHSSVYLPAPTIDDHAAATAASALQEWGALNPIDTWSVADSFRPDILGGDEKFSGLMDRVKLQQLRPRGVFLDTTSPTSLKERSLVVVDTSLISGVSFESKVERIHNEIGVNDLDSSSLDPTQLARLYYASKPEYRSLSPDAGVWWLAMARAARKQKNYRFAYQLLDQLRQQTVQRHPTVCDAALSYEDAALKMCGETPRDGVLTLLKLCDSVLHVRDDSVPSAAPDAVHVQSLLRLARTLASVDTGDQFASIEAAMSVMGSRIDQGAEAGLVGYRDALVKVCLESATEITPSDSRTWYEYSRWCHQQGRTRLEKLASNNGVVELLPDEEIEFKFLLEELCQVGSAVDEIDVRDGICRVMEGGSLLSNREQRLRLMLARVASNGEVSDNLVNRFVTLQTQIVSRLLLPLKLAATGYRSFLLAADGQKDGGRSSRLSSRITSVALRLLRMLTRFGSEDEVVTIVTDVLTVGPLAPWGRIVPQLLSRIGHSYKNVSSPVAALLVRLARQYPHLVVYPAIVESGRRKQGDLPGVKLLNDVVSELRSNAPDLTSTIERVVEELKRISVLWDDAWIWALMKMAGDVSRRISTLEKEAQRVEKNSSLSSDEKNQLARRKAIAIMKPVLIAVERLSADTIDQATSERVLTPHEKQFVVKYGASISTALQAFRSYCNVVGTPSDTSSGVDPVAASAPTSPASVWQPFADLLKTLLAAVGRRERVDLVEISPSLARISHKSKFVLMPGSFSSDDIGSSQMVTVSDISRTVSILRSKTKPKCLKFVGSDGQSHRYLLKAREDLHLDERMMQFLGTVNEFLRADRASSSRNLVARNYSVVPLSSDAGLIQMVPEVLPLFQIYTSRAEDLGASAQGPTATDGEQIALPQQQPPTAPFYAKLKQFGIQDVSPSQRSRWPRSVLRRAYEDLVAGRPTNVIKRELTLQSDSFADALVKQYRFNRSTAVMSVLGYVMGLGDRHLDNMLLCTETGELLHIDYNVCFDKGRKLKVPEIVPFRLTPIMVDALGLTGVEGVFRSAFANTMRVVRDADSREALLALLEAFVYDPLIDWVGDGKHQAISKDTKQRMDVNVNLSLFLSRARERWQDTTAFMEHFATTSTTIRNSMRELAEWLGPDVLAQCEHQSHAVEAKRHADTALGVAEQELNTAMVIRPEQQVELDALQGLIEADKTTLSAFAVECLGRHKQVQDMVTRIRQATITDPHDTVSGISAVGSLCRAHARILSITMQLPPSPSAPVWSNMLASLEARCVALDQQIPALMDQSSHIIRELALVLHVYKTQRCEHLQAGDGLKVDDVYGRWYQRCSDAISQLKSDHEEASRAMSQAVSRVLRPKVQPKCSREYHERVTSQLSREIADIKEGLQLLASVSGSDAEIHAIVEQFFNSLSAMKLSNSQTQRVIKLICVRWMLSTVDQLQDNAVENVVSLRDFPSVKGIRVIVQGVLVLRDMASTSRGAMKKTLIDWFGRETDDLIQPDSMQIVLTSVRSILQSLEAVVCRAAKNLSRSQFGLRDITDQVFDRDAGEASIGSIYEGIAEDIERLELAAGELQLDVAVSELNAKMSNLKASIDQWIQDAVNEPTHHNDGVSRDKIPAMVRDFLSESLMPIARATIHHVVTSEWKIDADVFRVGPSYVDKLASEAMPALGSGQSGSDFQACCRLLNDLWATWTARSAKTVREQERQEHVATLSKLLGEHEYHLAILRWDESGQGQEILSRIGRLAPAFPKVFDETSRVESTLLEVAQQLEYVASQVSFSCSLGFSAYEMELQSICKDVQDSYSRIARQFEVVRAAAEMAVGVNAIESSLERVCGGTVAESSAISHGEHEVDHVGRSLFETVNAHVERLGKFRGSGANSSTSTLKKQLDEARRNASQAQLEVLASSEIWERTSEALAVHNTETLERVRLLLKPVSAMSRLLRSLGLPSSAESEVSSDERVPSFALSENERLIKILLRSVESTTFMHSLHDVLVDHEKTHHEMMSMASAVGRALTKFVKAARSALEAEDASQAIHAIQELLQATTTTAIDHEEGLDSDLCSKTNELLQACCKSFFTAADLADELTKAEEHGGDDTADNSPHADLDGDLLPGDDENPMELSDDDLQDDQALSLPLRPIAGFQEQNSYGAEVVARIEEKLSGVVIECGSSDPLSIDDQSAWLIRAATNVDNLCVMYEGWTPWI